MSYILHIIFSINTFNYTEKSPYYIIPVPGLLLYYLLNEENTLNSSNTKAPLIWINIWSGTSLCSEYLCFSKFNQYNNKALYGFNYSYIMCKISFHNIKTSVLSQCNIKKKVPPLENYSRDFYPRDLTT